MKLHLLIIFSVFTWLYQAVYAKASSNFKSTQDTVMRLEKRVEKNLNILYLKIDEEKKMLETLHEQISKPGNDKKQLKKTKKDVAKIEDELNYNYQKQNAYRHLLTMIHQLKIQNENIANKQLKEIDIALKSLDKNKLPSIQNLKSIPALPYIRDNASVYEKEISYFCNMTRSPDGKILATEFESFFDYTDPKLSIHFKETDFLQCQTRFIKTKKEYFLELKFILNAPKASSIYGTIDPSTPSKIDFINGDFVYLETYAVTNGILDPATGSTIYNVQFKLDKEDISSIRKKDVDSITILWTSGADQFQICKIDLLRNLFECIQKRKLQN